MISVNYLLRRILQRNAKIKNKTNHRSNPNQKANRGNFHLRLTPFPPKIKTNVYKILKYSEPN